MGTILFFDGVGGRKGDGRGKHYLLLVLHLGYYECENAFSF